VAADGSIAIVGRWERWWYPLMLPFPVVDYLNYIALFDGNGDLLWRTSLGDAVVYGVTTTSDGTFMATGNVGSDLVVIEVDADGKVLN
jgi:hypothetical protein